MMGGDGAGFSSHVRTMGEESMNRSPPALFFQTVEINLHAQVPFF